MPIKDRKDRKTGAEHHSKAPINVVYRKIAELTLDRFNPRIHTPRQVRQIAQSIDTFGFLVPVVIDGAGNTIAGHGRILAALLLGWTEIPAICADHLSEAQLKAFMIADNRLTEISVWDDRLLAEQLKKLSLMELDFNLEVTGFHMGEIDLRIEGLASKPQDREDPADVLPEPKAGPTVTRLGDLWKAGEHLIYCASAREGPSFSALMQGRKGAMVFIDPPYNLRIDGNVSGLGSIHHREFAMASGEMNEAEFTDFLSRAFSLLADNTANGSVHFICMDWRHLAEILGAGRQTYEELLNVCVWAKANAGMGSFYRSQHELIFVFKNGRGPHRNNVQLGQFGRNRTNVWQYPGANSFARHSDEGNLLAVHPTVKPVQLVADAIMDCSARGDIVIDSFLGSGTTVIAAERTGRRCYGIELDPRYVDTIIRRWQAYTGEHAHQAASDRTFAELEAEVGKDHV